MLKRLALVATAMLLFASSGARAMPLATPGAYPDANIVLVYDGCGPYGHRGPYGGCRSEEQWGGYQWGRPCPPGFHLGRWGRRCWPN